MNGSAMVAAHLDEHVDAIIMEWRASVRRNGDVPRSETLTYHEFVDHIPELIDRMATRLRGLDADVATEGKKHGGMRWQQGYDITEVLDELGHLRSTLMQSTYRFARERHFDLAALESAHEAINLVLNEATTESVRQFQEESDARTKTALAVIEERRRAVEDAQITAESERSKLRTVVETLPIGVWVVDPSGRIVSCNREGERLQGFSAEHLLESAGPGGDLRSAFRIFRPDGAEIPPDQLHAARALRGEAVYQEEVTWRLPVGTRHVLTSAAPLKNAIGITVGAVVVVQDITERKRLESDLATSEARFRAIAEQSPVMIWRAGPDARCDYFNSAWLEFRGRSAGQEAGDGWVAGIHADDACAFLKSYREAFDHRQPFEVTCRFLRHDGQYRWVLGRGTPYIDAGGRFLGFLGSSIDITERIEHETDLQRRGELATEEARHKTRLIGTLSHDARTPLNAVGLSAQLLELHLRDSSDPEIRECLRTIRTSVNSVIELFGDMLDLTKLDAGGSAVEASRFGLGPALAECLGTIEPQARLKRLACSLDLGPAGGLAIETDRAKFRQIVCNLLSNALRYTERGSIRLVVARQDDELLVSVIDTGIGIPLEHQGRIFEEFARVDSRRSPGEGTGLGLAICRRLAHLLGGEIRLVSRPGAGSTFTLVLPAAALCTPDPAERPSEPRGGTAPGDGLILVVEDHEGSRKILSRLLRHLGYRVAEAGDGREALEIALRETPLAVLMDVNMPGMDGIEATTALRANPAFCDLPIFALTGDVTAENRRRIGEAGVDGYLEKPVTPEALLRALEAVAREG